MEELLNQETDSETGQEVKVPEYKIECVLELFLTVGYTLEKYTEQAQNDKNTLSNYFSRYYVILNLYNIN